MRYYYHPMSPNCRKTTAVLDLLGTECERHLVDLPRGEHFSAEFLAINPNGKVPTLVDGDQAIWESNAIAIHLAEKAGSELWPADPVDRLDVLKWMFWEQGHLMYATGILFFERLLKPMLREGDPDDGAIGKALGTFRRLAKVLDDHLAERSHLVASRLTLADLAVAGNLSYADALRLPVREYRHLDRWLATLDELQAWRDSAPPTPA